MINLSPYHLKIIKTCNLYLAFFMLGLSIAIAGPCLLDLQNIVNTDTQHIALIYTARSTGYLSGSLLGGIVLDMVKCKQAVLTVCNSVVSLTMLGIPWSGTVEVLLGIMIINGFCLGVLETGGNVVCLTLWGKHSGPYFQGLHFAFGIGGLIAPLIAAPYLEDYSPETMVNNSTHFNRTFLNSTPPFLTNNTVYSNANFHHATSQIPKIIYPFSYIGTFGLLISSLLLAVCIVSPTEDGEEESNKENNSKRSSAFMFFVVLLNFFLIFVGTGMEIGYAQMLTTFSVKGRLHVSTTVGSYMTSAFWASFTLFRLVSIFLVMKFKNGILIAGDITITSIAALMLLFLMPNESVLWLASVLFGMGIASFYPSVVGWSNEHIYVTNKIASIFTVGSAAGEMVVPFIISYFIDALPDMFSYVIAAACVLTAIMGFFLHMFFKKDDKRAPTMHKLEIYAIRTSSINI